MTFGFSARPVQIATAIRHLVASTVLPLPPHAPCRLQRIVSCDKIRDTCFASTRPVQIATVSSVDGKRIFGFASTRPVQIATHLPLLASPAGDLCLHTPRADCNSACSSPRLRQHTLPPHAPCRLQRFGGLLRIQRRSLPPHAPCRLQQSTAGAEITPTTFASTRPVQIATINRAYQYKQRFFASTRPVQIATAEMHRIAICTFQNLC